MKIIYAAFRHDPLDPSLTTGADAQFYNALKAVDSRISIVGPFKNKAGFIERLIKRIINTFTNKRYLKYDLTNTIKASRQLSKIDQEEKPDIIFTLYPPPIVFYRGNTTCIFRTDATILGVLEQSPEFFDQPWLLKKISLMLEKKALRKSNLIITHSLWSKKILESKYKINAENIFMLPNPSSLPAEVIPEVLYINEIKNIQYKPLRLLFIGSDPYRKGLAIARQTTKLLNKSGFETVLSVCGMQAENEEKVKYFGFLKRNDKSQFKQYIALLEHSHLLIHPALFDPAPRVTAEAAAFGTPTITNNSGGLATSVKNGLSGIVLPKDSPPEAYAQAISELVEDPDCYYALCKSTRNHYEKELNWDVTGKKLVNIIKNAINE